MGLRTPSFWYRRGGSPLSSALLPLSLLYRLGHNIHQRGATPYTSSIPVICIGNIVAGGSGKTPVALSIATLLKRHAIKQKPGFLTRGYGGSLTGPALVDPTHTAAQTGDEPLLLARTAPTVVSADRAAGARLAERNGADVIVMDDGLQNPGLHKTVKIVVIDGMTGFGNERLIPAGPLRMPLQAGLNMADAFVVIGGMVPDAAAASGKPVFRATIETGWKPAAGTSYFAFSGLGHPEKFFQTVRDTGADLKEVSAFPDHHAYTVGDLDALREMAAAFGARLVTTEKDAVRLPAGYDVDVVPIKLRWADENALLSFLKTKLAAP